MHNIVALYGLSPISIIIFPVVVAIFIFEIFMIVNAIRNDRIDDTRRILWVIGMLIIHPFIAIAYYFTDYQKNK